MRSNPPGFRVEMLRVACCAGLAKAVGADCDFGPVGVDGVGRDDAAVEIEHRCRFGIPTRHDGCAPEVSTAHVVDAPTVGLVVRITGVVVAGVDLDAVPSGSAGKVERWTHRADRVLARGDAVFIRAEQVTSRRM